MATSATSDRAIVLKYPTALDVACADPMDSAIHELTADGGSASDLLPHVMHIRITDRLQETAMAQPQIDNEVAALIALAKEQGWPDPVLDNSKIKWTNPEGGQTTTPSRTIGRGLQNIKTQLRRLGLDIPNPQAKRLKAVEAPASTPAPVEPTDLADPVVNEQPVTPEDAFAALGWLTEFVTRHQNDDSAEEWMKLADEQSVQLAHERARLDIANDTLDRIRMELTTSAPWEALPNIAALLGITKDK